MLEEPEDSISQALVAQLDLPGLSYSLKAMDVRFIMEGFNDEAN